MELSTRLLLGPLVGLALVLAACAPEEPSAPRSTPRTPPPDVVLILLDTLRADHLPAYGYDRVTAPYLDELAEGGTVFERAYSTSSWTAPSTASLFTGLYPPRHGVTTGFRAQHNAAGVEMDDEVELMDLVAMPTSIRTIPEVFQAAGYRTLGLTANVNVGEPLGFHRGFDRFALQHDDTAEELVETLAEWSDDLASEDPTFLYLHFNDVHKPYKRRDPWYRNPTVGVSAAMSRYDSEIGYVDQVLGELHGRFGWAEDTIVMVVSDHGEEFQDHGSHGHQFTLYGELNQVVMILHAPGREPGRVSANVSLVDVLPTLLDLTGIGDLVRFDQELAGRSLVPLLEGEALPERTLFAHRVSIRNEAPLWAAIQGRWKLIANDTTGTEELFDLEADPGELANRMDEEGEVLDRLRSELVDFRSVQPLSSARGTQVEVDAGLRSHLETLGYVGGGDDE